MLKLLKKSASEKELGNDSADLNCRRDYSKVPIGFFLKKQFNGAILWTMFLL